MLNLAQPCDSKGVRVFWEETKIHVKVHLYARCARKGSLSILVIPEYTPVLAGRLATDLLKQLSKSLFSSFRSSDLVSEHLHC